MLYSDSILWGLRIWKLTLVLYFALQKDLGISIYICPQKSEFKMLNPG